ncbi:MAG: DNA replication and repair protein RecF [Gemmatimonadales bacterium]|nr:DNA replication and repair protein RecF [Gemmatimonadales bacterium]
MRILSASIQGFRNLQESIFEFSPRVNLVLGRNGEGKTNLLESLNLFALGRSHRSAKNDEMIAFESESLFVKMGVEGADGTPLRCEYAFERERGSRFFLNGNVVSRKADLVGILNTVYFDPDSIHLVRGEPRRRRHFVDQGIAETDPLFLSHLTSFQRALRQKNGLLRDLKKGLTKITTAREELKAWNRELAHHTVEICLGRADYADRLTPCGDTAHRNLTGGSHGLEFLYRPALETVKSALEKSSEKGEKKEHLKAEILDEIDYIMETEIKRGRTLRGPQLDDFEVCRSGLDLRVFGSQGESRAAAISLILARSDVLFQKRQIRPVIFFDDIFSELDQERSHRLQEMASGLHQVFIATARPGDVAGWRPPEMKTWSVTSGEFKEHDTT